MGAAIGKKIMTVLSKMVDAAALSTFWLLCCIPVVTIGAASTALYYAVHKSLVRNRGYIWKNFWSAFRDNFKQATLAWLVQLALFAIFGLDIYIMRAAAGQGALYTVLLYLFYVLMALLPTWFYYTVAYQARFDNTVRNCLKNAGIIAFLNLPWSALVFLLFVFTVLVLAVAPLFIFLLPAVLFLVYDLILERIFRKYMKPEELERELENDMVDIE